MALQSCAMWSITPSGVLCGALQELCQCLIPLVEEDSLLNLEMLDIAEKDPWLLHLLPPPHPRSWRGETGHTDSQGVLHFWARGGCPLGGRIRPHMGRISSITTGICLFAGELNPCRFGEGYTPRSATRHPLSGVTTGNYLQWPSGWGDVLSLPIPDDNPGIITTTPGQTLQTIWLPSKDQGTVSKHNALPVTNEWLHHSLTQTKWLGDAL